MKEKLRVDADGVLHPVLTERGQEIPDPTPMAPPIGFKRQPPLHERIRAMVQAAYADERARAEVESPEEADDFIISGEEDDDPREARFAMMPGHEWEDNYEPPETFAEMRQRLVDAGWTPPPSRDAAKPARAPSGGAPAPGDDSLSSSSGDEAPPDPQPAHDSQAAPKPGKRR